MYEKDLDLYKGVMILSIFPHYYSFKKFFFLTKVLKSYKLYIKYLTIILSSHNIVFVFYKK